MAGVGLAPSEGEGFMPTGCFLVAVLGRAVRHPGAEGGKGKNTLDYKIVAFRQLSHAVKTSGRTSLLQPRAGFLFN